MKSILRGGLLLPVLYRPNLQNVAAELMGDEVIIIHVASGTYYNTEGIGAWIWELCAEGHDSAEILSLGCARFDVSRERLEADLQSFLNDLKTEDLVLEVSEGSIGQRMTPDPTGDRLPYRTPKLVAYRDLKDLLALDPPMPRLDGVAEEAELDSELARGD